MQIEDETTEILQKPWSEISENGIVNYRNYRSSDFPALYALEERCFLPPERFSPRYMRSLLTCENAATWVAVEEQEQVGGFAIVVWQSDADEMIAYIETLEVDAHLRRKGVGSELLERCAQSARKAGAHDLWLHVAEDNASAQALYKAHGFAVQGRESHYYGRNRHALVLMSRLAEA